MARYRAILALTVLTLAVGACSAHANNIAGVPHTETQTPAATRDTTGQSDADPSTAPTSTPQNTPGPDTSHGPLKLITSTGSSDVALTFDDGPGPYTAGMLDLLDRYHVKATFCLIGRQVHTYASVVRRMVADGMTLCNHTWDHDEKLRSRTDDQIHDELARTNQAIQSAAPGAKIEYFRNPGGAFGPNTVRIARSLGMKPLMWSVDPRDWANPGTQAIIANVLGHTHHGSIVLSHDGGGNRTATLTAYRTILPNLHGRFHLIAMPVT